MLLKLQPFANSIQKVISFVLGAGQWTRASLGVIKLLKTSTKRDHPKNTSDELLSHVFVSCLSLN